MASGKGEEKRDSETIRDDLSGPEGEEISLDPEAGDLLDPVERWWIDETEEEKAARRNRKVKPGEKPVARVVARDSESIDEVSEFFEEEVGPTSEGVTGAVAVRAEQIRPLTPIIPEEEVDEPEELFRLPPLKKQEAADLDESRDEELSALTEEVEGTGDEIGETDETDVGKTEDVGAPAAELSSAPPPAKRKAGCWTLFVSIFFFASIAVLVALVIGALWVWAKLGNLEHEIVNRLRPGLEKQGIYFDYEGWRYQYPRGLVIENVSLFETAKRERPVLRASDLGVNADIVALIRERSDPSSAEVSFDGSILTFFEEGREVGSISDLDGEIFVSREKVEFEGLSARVEGLRVILHGDFALSGAAEGSSLEAPAEETAKAEAGVFSLDLAPVMKVLPWFQIESAGVAPVLRVYVSLDADDPAAADLSATLNGGDFVWQGVPITSASVSSHYDAAAKTLQLNTFQVGYGAGLLSGTMALNVETRILAIKQMQSSLDLLALAVDLDPEMKTTLEEFSFVDAPTVQASGTVPLADPKLAQLALNYDHRLGLVYSGEGRSLPIRDLRGEFRFNRGTLETDDFTGRVLDGDMAINGSMRLTAEERPFSGLIEVSGLPLANVASYFEKSKLGMTGDIFFEFRGVGYSKIEKIRGGGTLRVDGAKLPAFPVIGPVQEFLGAVIPAFGIQGEGSLSGAYIIESGTLLTNDLTVAQSGAQLVTNGSLNLETQYVSFTTKAFLEPTLAKATGLESKTIEVSGSGDLSDPTLTLSGFPADFASEKLSEFLGTSPETLRQLESMIEGEDAAAILGAPLDQAIGEELGGEVRGLLEGLFGSGEPEAAEGAEAAE